MSRHGVNRDLPPLPDDAAFVEAVRAVVAENEAKMARAASRGMYYFKDPSATANEVAYRLRVESAQRLGNGAVGGSWSGYMSASLRVAPRLRALAKRGLLEQSYDDRSRNVYRVAEG